MLCMFAFRPGFITREKELDLTAKLFSILAR
jgi:hypothetical protein